MKKIASLLLAVFALGAVSCEKDETVSMRTRLIKQGTWRLQNSAITSLIGGETTISGPPSDFTYRFAENDAFFRKGTINNQVVEDQTGTWLFQQADTRIILTDSTLAGDYNIMQLDDTALIIRQRYTADGADSTAMLRRTFKRAS